ncbi:major facilitator superfamily domain-containing protein [Xylaria sp. FL0043]|nr:major facilitator superfamily domain-containing protein [Xylaria sp. FL0043]
MRGTKHQQERGGSSGPSFLQFASPRCPLPFISHELNAGDLYIWFMNAYFLTSIAFLPLLGQLCDLFGRRRMMLIVVALFALGSGTSGGTNNAATLISSRAVQGIGGGGINLLIELIVSDLVPLRERGTYFDIVFGVFSFGTAVGHLVGGAIVRIDYAGSTILTASVMAVLLALSWGGTKYPWSSYHVLVALIVGIFGLALFYIYEGMPWVREHPTLPERPCSGCPPTLSGVALLPTVLLSVLTGLIAGVLLSRWSHKPGLWTIFALPHTHRAEWVLVQAVAAFGLGIMMSTNLSSVQADLPDSDTAAATAALASMRACGSIWGISIPAGIFNAQFANLSWRIGDADIQKQQSGGNAYLFPDADYARSFPNPQRDRVIDVSLGFALLDFLLCFLQMEISLRSTIDTEFGLEQRKRSTILKGNREKEPVIPSA